MFHTRETNLQERGATMRKINRKTADPVVLHHYEQLRFERRYPKLGRWVKIIRGVAYGGVIPLFFVPESVFMPYLTVWVILIGAAVIVELALLVLWLPPGDRLRMAMILFGTITTAVLMLVGLFAAMDWIVGKYV